MEALGGGVVGRLHHCKIGPWTIILNAVLTYLAVNTLMIPHSVNDVNHISEA